MQSKANSLKTDKTKKKKKSEKQSVSDKTNSYKYKK